MLVERHGGKVPGSFAELEALPGVGHKTASVVLAIAFLAPTFPVDTHIHRHMPMDGFSYLWIPPTQGFGALCFGVSRALLIAF